MSALSFTRRGDDASVFVGVRLTRSLRSRLEGLAVAEGVSLSEVVRVLLEAGLTLASRSSSEESPEQ